MVFISTVFLGYLLLVIFALLILFHLLIILNIIPFKIVWAGRLKNRKSMLRMESISVALLLPMMFFLVEKIGITDIVKNTSIVNIIMWIMFGFFVLNTIGNFSAKHPFEKYFFGLITTIISVSLLGLLLL